MIGSLTIDKSSSNWSYFLKSIKIIFDNGGSISRHDFVVNMAAFMQTVAYIDGKEQRTPYNKLKLTQYFGFTDIIRKGGESWLTLTPRGELLANLILEHEKEINPEKIYYVDSSNIPIVRELFCNDIIYNSHGRLICGAERSNTDTDPVKIIIRLLQDRGLSTSNEIFYAIYSSNGGKDGDINSCLGWDEILNNITQFSASGKSYDTIFEKWQLTNFVKDPKILNLLSNESVDILRNYNGEYGLSPELPSAFIERMSDMSIFYSPLCEAIVSEDDYNDVLEWVQTTIVNKKNEDPALCFINYDDESAIENIIQHVLVASSHPKNSFFIVLTAPSQEIVWNTFGQMKTLLKRIEDYKSERNGYSEQKLTNYPISNIPANVNIVAIIHS